MEISAQIPSFKSFFSEKKGQNLGIVRSMNYKIPGILSLESGKTLSNVSIEYEIYGKMNADKSNVILICHALTGDAHAAGFHKGDKKPGWWNIVIGPNKGFDTNKYCVICSNILGGCKGTTGPSSIDPETGEALWDLISCNYYSRYGEHPEETDRISRNKTALCSCRRLNGWDAGASMDSELS